MSALPKPNEPLRRQSSYERLMEQLETIEERAPANILKIKRTIGLYERIYGMSSVEMREKLAAGEIDETHEICAWSQLISVHELILNGDA